MANHLTSFFGHGPSFDLGHGPSFFGHGPSFDHIPTFGPVMVRRLTLVMVRRFLIMVRRLTIFRNVKMKLFVQLGFKV